MLAALPLVTPWPSLAPVLQVVTLALPSLVQMGEGDPVVGMTRALGEATARAPQSWAGSQGQRAGGPATATLLYLPHMEVRHT
jgi:hypothetical protein